jgi:hypothetical protein
MLSFSVGLRCKYWHYAVGVLPIILTKVFSLPYLLKPISKELVEEEHPLFNRVIAKKSTA